MRQLDKVHLMQRLFLCLTNGSVGQKSFVRHNRVDDQFRSWLPPHVVINNNTRLIYRFNPLTAARHNTTTVSECLIDTGQLLVLIYSDSRGSLSLTKFLPYVLYQIFACDSGQSFTSFVLHLAHVLCATFKLH